MCGAGATRAVSMNSTGWGAVASSSPTESSSWTRTVLARAGRRVQHADRTQQADGAAGYGGWRAIGAAIHASGMPNPSTNVRACGRNR